MVVRQQRLDRLLVEHRGHEPPGNVTRNQALAILGEHRFRPTLPHPATARQTSGTADCSRAVPSAAAPSAPNKTPATAKREAVSPAGSRAGRVWRTAFRIPATAPPAPCPQSADRPQRMILWNPRLAAHVAEQHVALDIPTAHRTSPISSRDMTYNPISRPIGRLFPNPVSVCL